MAGLSALGAGVSFAGGEDETPPTITATANSSANAVAYWGGYNTPQGGEHKDPAPEGYGQHSSGSDQ
ncbi:hypothetical protein BFF78_27005 [Streptomyces fodineus]|uniref:Uncharacterized protein n=1 Tax=Streptomyces fodineus TaxID=1904616 RepID=A0A1D7YF39_9ACTN|nr:hypothetical protein BFF78_27005 [Streptomyces fodineus]